MKIVHARSDGEAGEPLLPAACDVLGCGPAQSWPLLTQQVGRDVLADVATLAAVEQQAIQGESISAVSNVKVGESGPGEPGRQVDDAAGRSLQLLPARAISSPATHRPAESCVRCVGGR